MPEPSVTQPQPQPQGISDFDLMHTMATFGGAFAQALAEAMYRADPDNRARIKAAFYELLAEYAEMARLHAERAKAEGRS